jgi:integrase
MPKRKRWRGGFIRQGIYWIDRNSHRDRFSTKCTTEAGALAALERWERGLRGPGEEVDVADGVKAYLAHSAATNSKKHVRMQGAAFNRWQAFLQQRDVETLQELTPTIASEFIVWRRLGGAAEAKGKPARPVGEAAINRDLAALMALYTWHRETEKIGEEVHPFKRVHQLAEHHEINPHREVAHADVVAAMDKLRPRWADAVLVLYGTAFRYDSFARINTAAIDRARSIIRDPTPKGKVAVEVPASPEVIAAALRACGERYPRDEAQQLGRRLRIACKAAGVQRFTAHDLRVTAATFMLRAGVSLRDLQDLLGHKDIRTTQRYLRASGKMARGPV